MFSIQYSRLNYWYCRRAFIFLFEFPSQRMFLINLIRCLFWFYSSRKLFNKFIRQAILFQKIIQNSTKLNWKIAIINVRNLLCSMNPQICLKHLFTHIVDQIVHFLLIGLINKNKSIWVGNHTNKILVNGEKRVKLAAE